MKSILRMFAAMGLLLLVPLTASGAKPSFGQREFATRCQMCHGPAGRGDGWLAEQLIKRPPTLSLLTRKNGGVFPREQVARKYPGGDDPALIGLAMGAYGLTQGLLQLPFGMASDRLGRKRVIVFGLLVFAAGSFLAAAATTVAGLIVGRLQRGMCRLDRRDLGFALRLDLRGVHAPGEPTAHERTQREEPPAAAVDDRHGRDDRRWR